MELYRRADKRSASWYVDWTDKTGKRRRQSLGCSGTKREAESKARALIGEKEAEQATDGGKPIISLKTALHSYADHLKSDKKTSWENTVTLVRKTLGGFEGRWGIDPALPLHTLTPAHMTKLVRARREEGNGNQTIAHEIKTIRAACRLAAGEGWRVPEDMLTGTIRDAWRMPKLTMKTRYLTVEEFHACYAYLDPERQLEVMRAGKVLHYPLVGPAKAARQDCQDLLVALAMTGGRWSEVISLRWDRIDTAALDACYSPQPVEETAKAPVITITLWGNKTTSERVVCSPDMLTKVLLRRWRNRIEGQPLVFPSSRTGKLRVQDGYALRKAMDACGVNSPERVAEAGRATVHSLRHTFASLLLQNGANLAEIQEALGHTSLNMTRRYASIARRDSAAKLAAVLNTI